MGEVNAPPPVTDRRDQIGRRRWQRGVSWSSSWVMMMRLLFLLLLFAPCGDVRSNRIETVQVQVLELNTFYRQDNQGFPGNDDEYYAIAWEMFADGAWHVVDACRLDRLPMVGRSNVVWLKRAQVDETLLRVRYQAIIHSRTPTVNVWADEEWAPGGNQYHVDKF